MDPPPAAAKTDNLDDSSFSEFVSANTSLASDATLTPADYRQPVDTALGDDLADLLSNFAIDSSKKEAEETKKVTTEPQLILDDSDDEIEFKIVEKKLVEVEQQQTQVENNVVTSAQAQFAVNAVQSKLDTIQCPQQAVAAEDGSAQLESLSLQETPKQNGANEAFHKTLDLQVQSSEESLSDEQKEIKVQNQTTPPKEATATCQHLGLSIDQNSPSSKVTAPLSTDPVSLKTDDPLQTKDEAAEAENVSCHNVLVVEKELINRRESTSSCEPRKEHYNAQLQTPAESLQDTLSNDLPGEDILSVSTHNEPLLDSSYVDKVVSTHDSTKSRAESVLNATSQPTIDEQQEESISIVQNDVELQETQTERDESLVVTSSVQLDVQVRSGNDLSDLLLATTTLTQENNQKVASFNGSLRLEETSIASHVDLEEQVEKEESNSSKGNTPGDSLHDQCLSALPVVSPSTVEEAVTDNDCQSDVAVKTRTQILDLNVEQRNETPEPVSPLNKTPAASFELDCSPVKIKDFVQSSEPQENDELTAEKSSLEIAEQILDEMVESVATVIKNESYNELAVPENSPHKENIEDMEQKHSESLVLPKSSGYNLDFLDNLENPESAQPEEAIKRLQPGLFGQFRKPRECSTRRSHPPESAQPKPSSKEQKVTTWTF